MTNLCTKFELLTGILYRSKNRTRKPSYRWETRTTPLLKKGRDLETGSLKVTGSGTIKYLEYGFLFQF